MSEREQIGWVPFVATVHSPARATVVREQPPSCVPRGDMEEVQGFMRDPLDAAARRGSCSRDEEPHRLSRTLVLLRHDPREVQEDHRVEGGLWFPRKILARRVLKGKLKHINSGSTAERFSTDGLSSEVGAEIN